MVLNLWVMTPLVSKDFFIGVAYQIFTLPFIIVAKLQLWSRNEIILWLGVNTTRRTLLKGSSVRKVENHCFIAPSIDEGDLLHWIYWLCFDLMECLVLHIKLCPKRESKSEESMQVRLGGQRHSRTGYSLDSYLLDSWNPSALRDGKLTLVFLTVAMSHFS